MKSLFRFLNYGGIRSTHAPLIWETKCPLKMRVFLWPVHKNMLPTGDNLSEEDGKAQVGVYYVALKRNVRNISSSIVP